MDPSPFQERDLDDDAEEFIVSWAQEFPRRDQVSLVIHVNQIPVQPDAQHLVETAVHHYFAYRAKLKRLELRHLLNQGRTSLIIGLAFLAACMLASQLRVVNQERYQSFCGKASSSLAGWPCGGRWKSSYTSGGLSCAKAVFIRS